MRDKNFLAFELFEHRQGTIKDLSAVFAVLRVGLKIAMLYERNFD